ncbi:MAG: dihydrofolate reductase [Bacilli bacterium]
MNNIVLIAATCKNNELGMNNKLIWYLPSDLKFFKEQTLNKHIVMGINTFKSLPKLLPSRKHIVLTHQNIDLGKDVTIFHNKDELLKYIENIKDEVFIIGGAQIYNQFINDANKLILTEIEKEEKNADAYFPYFDKTDYSCKEIVNNIENNIKYKHLIYERKIRK